MLEGDGRCDQQEGHDYGRTTAPFLVLVSFFDTFPKLFGFFLAFGDAFPHLFSGPLRIAGREQQGDDEAYQKHSQ